MNVKVSNSDFSKSLVLTIVTLTVSISHVIAQPERATTLSLSFPPAPVSNLSAADTDDDHGHAVTLTWTLSPDDKPENGNVSFYRIYRAPHPDSAFILLGSEFAGTTSYINRGSRDKSAQDHFPDNTPFYYKVEVVGLDTLQSTFSEVVGPVTSFGQWFHGGRIAVALAVFLFLSLTVYFVTHARRGKTLYVRPLAGIEAVDDAIGRATEMGKPLLYLLGAGEASEIATIASFTILGRVAKRVAEYQTPIIVPCYDPVVMTVAQEVVRTAYIDAGRADDYKEDSVFFITNNQFAYVAAVNGIMLRELPATNLYMGKFYAESLIFAETGALAGSIQISGTDEIAQIPFFVVACDYALIGEELYAASAYLGREPTLLGTLKAQDYAKAAIILCAIIGTLLLSVGMEETGLGFKSLFKVVD